MFTRIRKWWRAPYERQKEMLAVVQMIRRDQQDNQHSNCYWQRAIMNDISKIETALDAATIKLATTQADVGDLKAAVTELGVTAKALADAVKALKTDAPKTDIQADLDRLQVKAEALLSKLGEVNATVATVKSDAVAAEDIADDELVPAVEGDGIGLSEDGIGLSEDVVVGETFTVDEPVAFVGGVEGEPVKVDGIGLSE